MSTRKSRAKPEGLSQLNLNAAGIDVGATSHFVAVPADRAEQPVREFEAFTADLYRLADWLSECGVETVVMESTGVYWIPLFGVLEERGLEVMLVDRRRIKNVPGRKTDVRDCQWLQQLHTYGLLSGAFRPDGDIRRLRSYLRQRAMLVEYASQHIQHMQKALTQMNVKLQHVISDITGKTGMDIMEAIAGGERDPRQLARLRDPRIKADEATIAKSLQGHWREEHIFELTQALELYRFYQDKIAECDREIAAQLERFEDRSDGEPPAPNGKKRNQKNAPRFDVQGQLYRMTGVDLTRIDGVDAYTALKVVSEIGTDMTKWPSAKHFASWLGLSPNNRITGGRVMSSKTKPSANRAAAALRLAANALHRSDSALGAYLRGASRPNIVCYCRVSSAKQRGDLNRQVAQMRDLYPDAEIVTDVAGGLNWQRRGLLSILERLHRGDKLDVVVAHRDRLARFGFELIEWLVVQNGGAVLVLNQSDASPESELTEDLLAILHTFSCRIHGLRRYGTAIAHDPGLPEPTAEGSDSNLAGRESMGLQPDG